MSSEPSLPRASKAPILLLANLDCEDDWARDVGAERASSRRLGAASTLSPAAATAAALAGSLMRVLAESAEDQLWLPADSRSLRLAALPGMVQPVLLGGAIDPALAAGELLAWGETRAVAALRGRQAAGPSSPAAAAPVEHRQRRGRPGMRGPGQASRAALLSTLRGMQHAEPGVARRANHRAGALGLALETGRALPGARMIDSQAALGQALSGGASRRAGADQRWVLKAPLSAAGRRRVIGTLAELRDGPARETAEALLAAQGALLLEPWMERIDDWACVGLVDETGPRLLGAHQLHNDARGRFMGIELVCAQAGAVPSLDRGLSLAAPERAELLAAFQLAGDWLAGIGYRGPFGIDAWRYRSAQGEIVLNPLGEINARLTMGLLAHATAASLVQAEQLMPAARIRMRLGRRRSSLDPSREIPLAALGGLRAWIETLDARAPALAG